MTLPTRKWMWPTLRPWRIQPSTRAGPAFQGGLNRRRACRQRGFRALIDCLTPGRHARPVFLHFRRARTLLHRIAARFSAPAPLNRTLAEPDRAITAA